ncbi:similar to Saccharomyces cerevisiae YDL142C CRD1 Cardiolipin synthase [Maudiozyma saulgeensis]|uniref:Similar to Saccharomyces cerevisiae YDL142C CRD1 Cardiolipin synthase n=1 Tax=Maudiozyma saulgeensis TaxID=1789683 RepID=A0A1X7R2I9_9SACH|nr:similar to Saccharomyces cerevisiae YDL142C CRD1 Cardiolipin synthase [Kazachstania saulgeensis]
MYKFIGTRSAATTRILTKCNLRSSIHTTSIILNEQKTVKSVQSNKVLTIPNVLTMSRIAATPFIGHFIITSNLTPALGIFAYCCITDFLDGYIARKYKLGSMAGSILDPMADKLLMLVTTVAMTMPSGPAIIPLPLAFLIVGRDFGLAVAAFVLRYTSLKKVYKRITWKSYWNFFKYPSAMVKPSQISKWNTFLQMIYLGLGVIVLMKDKKIDMEGEENDEKDKENTPLLTSFKWLGFIVGGTTVLSGASYALSRNAIRVLKI